MLKIMKSFKSFKSFMFLIISSTVYSATPLIILNNDTLNIFDQFDYYILTDNYERAFPDSFSIAKTEFDKRDITQRLIQTAQDIKLNLIQKSFVLRDYNFKLSEYDFDKKAFYLNYEVLSLQPNWKEELNTSMDNLNKVMTGKKINKTNSKTPDTLFIRGRSGSTQINMFVHSVFPIGIPFLKQVESRNLVTTIPISDELKAREIANWNVKKEYFQMSKAETDIKGIYIIFKLTQKYFAIPSGKAIITMPSSILFLDENKNTLLLLPYYKGK